MHSGTIVCPKCHTHLRHIGSDYDRPIENYRCQSCSQSFVEGDVQVRCAMCENEMKPGDLVLSPFAGIGSEGHVALKMGRRFVGAELKRSYWEQARRNLAAATAQMGLFDMVQPAPSETETPVASPDADPLPW